MSVDATVVEDEAADPAALPPVTDRLRLAWNAAVLVVPVVAMAVLGWRRRWISDDGLITIRTVRQILAGHGPVINVNERAEANTSTLWTWLITLVTWVTGKDPAKLAVYGGLACTVIGLALAVDGTRRLYQDSGLAGLAGRWLVPVGVLVIVAMPPFWDFATSGLETGPTFAWMGLSWWLLVRRQRGAEAPPAWVILLVLSLGPMIRPELGVPAVLFAAGLWVLIRPSRRRTALWLVPLGALPLGYEIFRAGYYGVLVPNTAIAKEASGSHLGFGWTYLMDTVRPYRLWFPAAVLAALLLATLAIRRPGRADLTSTELTKLVAPGAAVLSGLLLQLYVLRLGGDFMHARMNLPAFFLILLPVGILPLTRAFGATAALIGVWAGLCLTSFRTHNTWEGAINAKTGISDERQYYVNFTHQAHPITGRQFIPPNLGLVEYLDKARAMPQPTLADWGEAMYRMRPDAGGRVGEMWNYLGTQGDVTTLHELDIDPYGLPYPLAAHLAITVRGRPGHEKRLPDYWIVADFGDPAVTDVAAPPSQPDPDFAAKVATARRALACGQLAELQHAVRDRVTWGRFWKNLTGSVSRTTFRFPQDPAEAERRYCR